MTFSARIGDDFLYTAPDGREAFIIFNPVKAQVSIVTDIHQEGPPNNAVGFNSTSLRRIADRLDRLTDEHEAKK